MRAARLHAARDFRIDEVDEPGDPDAGQVLIRVTAVGICGSDLHSYEDGRIGDTVVQQPLILGHEFAGQILACGDEARDGNDELLQAGQRVAVDPAQPCLRCELCLKGHPNLCPRLHFCGLWPDEGALCERMLVPAHGCFPLPNALSDAEGALLEPLGVALHAVDLARLRLAQSVVVLGCGPIGLLIVRLARLAGADPIYACDRFPWRAAAARAWGASEAWCCAQEDSVERVEQLTAGRGADTVFEAAWADESVAEAAEMARPGGRVVLVGIPSADVLSMKHSTARRKGLTLLMSRRMKHTYPRSIRLAQGGAVALEDLISRRYPLDQTAEAFASYAAWEAGVQKLLVDI
ncbi:MAG: alcohol dehydrogenase catalytic domain-containing protein [Anaerolineae bacterium]|nr:alcohol dehydrogenase catalytic domain-containing protein [Anaerolineae bacterium]